MIIYIFIIAKDDKPDGGEDKSNEGDEDNEDFPDGGPLDPIEICKDPKFDAISDAEESGLKAYGFKGSLSTVLGFCSSVNML